MADILLLQEKTDLELIQNYREGKSIAAQILLDRYKGITYSYALRTFKKVKNDYSVEVEDLVEDYKEQLLIVFGEKINFNRIKNKNNFSTIGVILKRFNAYYKVIKKRYSQACTRDFYEQLNLENHSDFSYNGYNKLEMQRIMSNKKISLKNSNYAEIISIQEFENNIKNSLEKKCFKYLKQGFKGFEIAEKLKISNSTVCNIKKNLKYKFTEFMQLEGKIE